MDNLCHRHVVIVNVCPLSLQKEETMDHLLFNYKIAQRMWVAVFRFLAVIGCCRRGSLTSS